MSKVKKYNVEEYSVFDIVVDLEKKGLQVQYIPKKMYEKYQIEGTHVYIDFPHYDEENDLIFANIRFDDAHRDDQYESDLKLYQQLSRKYGCKKGERPKKIKDYDKIQQFMKEQKPTLLKSLFTT